LTKVQKGIVIFMIVFILQWQSIGYVLWSYCNTHIT